MGDFFAWKAKSLQSNREIKEKKGNNNLDRMIKKQIITEKEKNDTMCRISFDTQLKASVINSDLVIEAATEKKLYNPHASVTT